MTCKVSPETLCEFSSQKTAQAASLRREQEIRGASAEFLSMRSVDVARGQKVVLQDINLKIATGEHVAILGPNGCGKSTLIKAMMCECYPIVRPGMEMKVYGPGPVGGAGAA